MTSGPCDVCGEGVRIAGGIDDLWNFPTSSSDGVALELVDGSEHFLCFDCIERLPDDREPTVEGVTTLQAPILRPCRCHDRTPERWVQTRPGTPLTVGPSCIINSFPAPSFRGTQEWALRDIRDTFTSDNDVVLARAPTRSDKLFLARAIAGSAATVDEISPTQATDAYYITPQVSQLDDVAEDDLLSDLEIIRDKSSYNCIAHGEKDTPVDHAPCTRKHGFDHSIRHRCPCSSDRAIVSNRQVTAMTLIYLMQTAGSDVFRRCDVVVVDEARGLAEQAEMYATIGLKPQTIPVRNGIGVPDVAATGDPVKRAPRLAETLVGVCEREEDELLTRSGLMLEEATRRDRLQEFIGELNQFVEDYRDPRSPATQVVGQHDDEGSPIAIKPLDPAKYLKRTVWDHGDKLALLSATILNKTAFCRSVGLDPSKVTLMGVEHAFPVENRPLYNVTQRKMTYEYRDRTLPEIARLTVRLVVKHPDERGLVHCRLYAIQAELRRRFTEMSLGNRVRSHDHDDRNAELETQRVTDHPEVFLSVKVEEALDLNSNLCRWQVLCKASYLNTNDSKVAHRLEDGQWAWYRHAALRTVVQTYGRAVHAPDNYGGTYVADSSLLQLFNKTRVDMPD